MRSAIRSSVTSFERSLPATLRKISGPAAPARPRYRCKSGVRSPPVRLIRPYGSYGGTSGRRAVGGNSRNHGPLGLHPDGRADGRSRKWFYRCRDVSRRGARRSAMSSWPRHMYSSPVQVSRTRLQLSQKL